MASKRRGVLVALTIGSIVGGTAGATIMDAASASQAGNEHADSAHFQAHERAESAHVQAHVRADYRPGSSAT